MLTRILQDPKKRRKLQKDFYEYYDQYNHFYAPHTINGPCRICYGYCGRALDKLFFDEMMKEKYM